MTGLEAHIERHWGQPMRNLTPLSGGCIGEVYAAQTHDGKRVVVKVDRGALPRLDLEGYMLGYLRDHSPLPVPEIYCSTPSLLVMDFVEGSSSFCGASEAHAADLLAALHGAGATEFGLERDTLIGGLSQPNPWTKSWLAFFRDHRLLYMAEEARRHGTLPRDTWQGIQRLAARLADFLEEPAQPALLHGDVWTTNVLARNGRITAFLDPAIYYGHPEMELAFITLFGTFGAAFFERYAEIRGIQPGFFETRRDIYNLYPLLVHTRLFGGGYASSVAAILQRLGF